MLIRGRDWVRRQPLFFRTLVGTLLFVAPYFLIALLLGHDHPGRVIRVFVVVTLVGLVVFYVNARYNTWRGTQPGRRTD